MTDPKKPDNAEWVEGLEYGERKNRVRCSACLKVIHPRHSYLRVKLYDGRAGMVCQICFKWAAEEAGYTNLDDLIGVSQTAGDDSLHMGLSINPIELEQDEDGTPHVRVKKTGIEGLMDIDLPEGEG